MVIISTSADEVIIQAVSPLSIFGAGAARLGERGAEPGPREDRGHAKPGQPDPRFGPVVSMPASFR